jgi:hypothetical protein
MSAALNRLPNRPRLASGTDVPTVSATEPPNAVALPSPLPLLRRFAEGAELTAAERQALQRFLDDQFATQLAKGLLPRGSART